MTKEELLKPRYKVIADYPGNIYHEGQILKEVSAKHEKFVADGHDQNFQYVQRPANYPAVFKKMEWWEERDKKDMPKYLKDRYRPGMVNNLFVYKVKHHFTRDMTSIDCAVKKDAKYWVDENDFSHIYTHYEAATEAEFNSQKQTTNG